MVTYFKAKIFDEERYFENKKLDRTAKMGAMSSNLYSLYDWIEEVQNPKKDDLNTSKIDFFFLVVAII